MSVTIRAAGVRVTDRAIQIDLDGERHWLPKSQIDSIDGESNINGDFIDDRLHEFVISDWIAQQKGFVLNEERYHVEGRTVASGAVKWFVKDGSSDVCASEKEQQATIIAAALNLTIGKV